MRSFVVMVLMTAAYVFPCFSGAETTSLAQYEFTAVIEKAPKGFPFKAEVGKEITGAFSYAPDEGGNAAGEYVQKQPATMEVAIDEAVLKPDFSLSAPYKISVRSTKSQDTISLCSTISEPNPQAGTRLLVSCLMGKNRGGGVLGRNRLPADMHLDTFRDLNVVLIYDTVDKPWIAKVTSVRRVN